MGVQSCRTRIGANGRTGGTNAWPWYQPGRFADKDAMQPVIAVENLTKRYKNAEVNALDGISFSVAAGEFFALLGPHGAGKTTTISILTTTLAPTAGAALIAGHDVVHAAG